MQYIKQQWKYLIDINKSPEVSPSILWEAAKAYLRGAIISYTSAKKKEAMKNITELEKKIQTLEIDFKVSPSRGISQQLNAARSALDLLLTKKAESSIFWPNKDFMNQGINQAVFLHGWQGGGQRPI